MSALSIFGLVVLSLRGRVFSLRGFRNPCLATWPSCSQITQLRQDIQFAPLDLKLVALAGFVTVLYIGRARASLRYLVPP